MQGPSDETVGTGFSEKLLEEARDKTLEVLTEISKTIRPGFTETETKALLQSIQSRMGAPKSWHPPQIRFGQNTLLGFGKRGFENVPLAENDIYFLDIGPIFAGHEGDVGRTYYLGQDPEMKKCCTDIEVIWNEVRDHWEHAKVSGVDLYDFARKSAAAKGWDLCLDQANGHRIADFPHSARTRGSIEGWEAVPASKRWILEIQIKHPSRPFGGFYEDLLS